MMALALSTMSPTFSREGSLKMYWSTVFCSCVALALRVLTDTFFMAALTGTATE